MIVDTYCSAVLHRLGDGPRVKSHLYTTQAQQRKLQHLIALGLVEKDEASGLMRLTDPGTAALKACRRLEELMDDDSYVAVLENIDAKNARRLDYMHSKRARGGGVVARE